MKIASHNSWSYARPKSIFLWPFRFMARCQSRNIKEQYAKGARMFDLRLFFKKDGTVTIRHGIMDFKVSQEQLFDDLAWLNEQIAITHEPVYVRVILEQNKDCKRQIKLENQFIDYCKSLSLEQRFIQLSFVEGVRKFDWKKLYFFKSVTPCITHRYSSTTSMFGEDKNKWYAKLDDLWPWLYAKLHNKKTLEQQNENDGFLMIDFI